MHEKLLDAAARALRDSCGAGLEFGDPTELKSSNRSVVLRVPVSGPAAPAPTVIVKSNLPDEAQGATDGSERTWENEVAAITLLDGLPGGPFGPALLAADRQHRALVLGDLGDHPALSDLLLGSDAAAAEQSLVDWATALGRIAALTREPRPLVERSRTAMGLSESVLPLHDFLRSATSGLSELGRTTFRHHRAGGAGSGSGCHGRSPRTVEI